jgi:putative oxidoreductase
MNTYARYLPALGRLLIAVLFLLSGLNKLAAPAATQAYITSAGLPFPFLAYLMAVIVEIGGSVLADQNQMIHFLKDVAIAGGLLQIAAYGAGGLSIDSRRAR